MPAGPFVLQHQKTYLECVRRSNASDESAHSCSLIRFFTGHIGHIWIAKDTKFLHMHNKDSDQTASQFAAHVRRYIFLLYMSSHLFKCTLDFKRLLHTISCQFVPSVTARLIF